MATTIKLKNGSGAPLAGDLVQGEPALDLTNKRLYTENAGGTVIEIGTNPGTDVTFADNRKAIFGTGSDLEIYHNGSDSFINETGTGDLKVQAAGQIKLGSPTGEFYATFNENSDVVLWYDNAAKLATTSTGIDVTGTSLADTLETSTGTGGLINIIRDDPTVGTNNSLGAIYWKSTEDSGTTVNIGAGILALADQNHSTIASGSRLVFQTTAISSTSPTDRMVINSSGNVGIGIASPSTTLHVSGAQNTDILYLDDGSEAGHRQLEFTTSSNGQIWTINSQGDSSGVLGVLAFATKGTERMRIDGSGNVDLYQGNNLTWRYAAGSTIRGSISVDSADNITFSNGSSNTERMRIDSSGNVGIGTLPSSNTRLYVRTAAATDVAYLADNSVNSGFKVKFNSGSTAVLNDFNAPLILGTNDTERMRIDSSGNVGIGTSSPNSYANYSVLTLRGTSGGEIDFEDSSGNVIGSIYNGATNFVIASDFNNAVASSNILFTCDGTERMRIDSSGNLLVGATSPSNTTGTGVKLFPEGYGGASTAVGIVGASSTSANSGFRMYSTGASAYRFYVDYAGTIFATSTSISAISDASLKENVRDLDKGLDTINALQPRRFDWKNGDGNDIMGFIAQEVEEVMPELVHDYKYTNEETKLGLKMGDMIPSMVKAIQELSAQVNELKAEVAALKGA